MKNPPVLFCGFARIHGFKKIIKFNLSFLKESKVYLSLDGPRNETEKEIQNQILNLFKKNFDCLHVKRHKNNLGCAKAIPAAINWFFEHEKQGIIIEDDIFCKKPFFDLAKKYLCNKTLKATYSYFIGYNPVPMKIKNSSCIFTFFRPTVFHKIWGWATTREMWNYFDANACSWPLLSLWRYTSSFSSLLSIRIFFLLLAIQTKQKKNSAWDISWYFSLAKKGFTQLICDINLVTNYGYDHVSTHCSPTYTPEKISLTFPQKSIAFNSNASLLSSIAYKKAYEISLYKILRQFFVVLFPFWFFWFIRYKVRPAFFKFRI